MSSSPLESWNSIIKEIRDSAPHAPGCACPSFNQKGQFMKAVKIRATKQYDAKDIHRELIRLDRSDTKIDSIAQAVGSHSGAEPIQELLIASAAWSLRYTVFEHGFKKKIRLKSLVDTVLDLEKRLPTLTPTPGPASYTRPLQLPLQKIVVRFLRSYVHVIETIEQNRVSLPPDVQPFFDDSEAQFNSAKEEYTKAQEIAEAYNEELLLQHAPRSVDEPVFRRGEKLGQGSFSKVYVMRDKKTGEEYAEKDIPSGTGESVISPPEKIREEIRIMGRLRHHHLTSLRWWTQDERSFKIYIQPVAEKNLKDILTYPHNLASCGTETQYFEWFGCLAAALNYMHSCGIKHKDIKASNILVKEQQVFLSDFGASLDWSSRDSSMTNGGRLEGTQQYWAPECREGQDRTEKVDTFAMGCVFAEMLANLFGLTIDQYDDERVVQCESKEFRACKRIASNLETKRMSWRTEKGTSEDAIAKTKFIIGLVKDLLFHEADDRLSSRQLYGRFLHEEFGIRKELLLCNICHGSAGR